MTSSNTKLVEKVGKAIGDTMGVCTWEAAVAAVEACYTEELREALLLLLSETRPPKSSEYCHTKHPSARAYYKARALLAKLDGTP